MEGQFRPHIRYPFVTHKGHFGAAPESIEVGDRIALVLGLGRPIIIRHRDSSLCMVGTAQITGMMRGELWKSDDL